MGYDIIFIILHSIIFGLLLQGSYSDFINRTVSNRITFAIALLCMPLIISYNTVGWFQVLIILILLFVYFSYHGIGGADLKVIVPLICIYPLIQLLIFLSTILIIDIALHFKYGFKNSVPFFIPITAGYTVVFLVMQPYI